jgi:hypothetical protein
MTIEATIAYAVKRFTAALNKSHQKSAKHRVSLRRGRAMIFDREPILADLAPQDGAFTWGVLDRILEEPWLRIDVNSGN